MMRLKLLRHPANAGQLVLTDASTLTAAVDWGVLSSRSWRLADLGAKKSMLLAGLGWGNMPAHMVEDEIKDGRLTVIQPAGFNSLTKMVLGAAYGASRQSCRTSSRPNFVACTKPAITQSATSPKCSRYRAQPYTEPLGGSVRPLRAGSRPSAIGVFAGETGRSILDKVWPRKEGFGRAQSLSEHSWSIDARSLLPPQMLGRLFAGKIPVQYVSNLNGTVPQPERSP